MIMKKLLFLSVICTLISCEDRSAEVSHIGSSIYIETIRGHDYIIYDGMYKGGIIHAESCPCKQNKKEEE